MTKPTHERGGVLDLVHTNVPDTVKVKVCAKLGNSNRYALKLGITATQHVQPVVCKRVVYLKNRVDWNLVRPDVLSI